MSALGGQRPPLQLHLFRNRRSPGGEVLRRWGPLACDPGLGAHDAIHVGVVFNIGAARIREIVKEI